MSLGTCPWAFSRSWREKWQGSIFPVFWYSWKIRSNASACAAGARASVSASAARPQRIGREPAIEGRRVAAGPSAERDEVQEAVGQCTRGDGAQDEQEQAELALEGNGRPFAAAAGLQCAQAVGAAAQLLVEVADVGAALLRALMDVVARLGRGGLLRGGVLADLGELGSERVDARAGLGALAARGDELGLQRVHALLGALGRLGVHPVDLLLELVGPRRAVLGGLELGGQRGELRLDLGGGALVLGDLALVLGAQPLELTFSRLGPRPLAARLDLGLLELGHARLGRPGMRVSRLLRPLGGLEPRTKVLDRPAAILGGFKGFSRGGQLPFELGDLRR